MTEQRSLGVAPAIVRFEIASLVRTPFFLHNALLSPIAFFVFLALGQAAQGRDLLGTEWFTASTAGIWATTTTAVGIIGYQRFQGTLEPLAVAPLRPGFALALTPASASLLGIIAIPISLGLQLFSGSIRVTPESVLGLVLVLISCASSSLAVSAIFIASRNATAFEPLLLIPVWLLSGLIVPLAAFPEPLRLVASLFPLTLAVGVAQQGSLAAAIPLGMLALLVSAIWAGLGFRAIGRAAGNAYRTGTFGFTQ
ncbi:MAG TPA: hypothetical protein VK139_08095 [Microbacteriaceae bacterium]|nr:hypothetical protein [Microbacteriaceae bacterium]